MAATATSAQPAVPVQRDITYATFEGDRELQLDLYMPVVAEGDAKPPLVVWVHGGAWVAGGRNPCPIRFLTEEGFAVASISYRFATEAVFPAQLHDCKAAVRFLRASAARYGYDAERIGVAGASAGGHLVALLGTAGNAPQAEGEVGEHDGESSEVQAVVDLFGPTDLPALHGRTSLRRGDESPVTALLGGPPEDKAELARSADPVTYIDADDPPVLILHGTADELVPLSQSEYLAKALEQAGVEHRLVVLEGAGHGGRQFNTPERRDELVGFFQEHLVEAGRQGG